MPYSTAVGDRNKSRVPYSRSGSPRTPDGLIRVVVCNPRLTVVYIPQQGGDSIQVSRHVAGSQPIPDRECTSCGYPYLNACIPVRHQNKHLLCPIGNEHTPEEHSPALTHGNVAQAHRFPIGYRTLLNPALTWNASAPDSFPRPLLPPGAIAPGGFSVSRSPAGITQPSSPR